MYKYFYLCITLMLKIFCFLCDIHFLNIYMNEFSRFMEIWISINGTFHTQLNVSKYCKGKWNNGAKFANKGQALGSEKLNRLAMSMTYECSPMSICHVNDKIVRRPFLLIQSHINFLHAHATRIQCMNFCARIS